MQASCACRPSDYVATPHGSISQGLKPDNFCAYVGALVRAWVGRCGAPESAELSKGKKNRGTGSALSRRGFEPLQTQKPVLANQPASIVSLAVLLSWNELAS